MSVSRTAIDTTAVLDVEFNAASATVKVTSVFPTANSSGRLSVILPLISPSLLSLAASAAKKAVNLSSSAATTSPGIATLRLIAPGTVNSGAITSKLTVTAVSAVASLPAASDTVKVSVDGPKGKFVGALLAMPVTTPSTLSVAEAEAINPAIASTEAATPVSVPSTESVAGTVITGAV